jgi:glutamine amidotransferase
MSLITVVDYNIVNVGNVLRALTHVGAEVEVSRDPQTILKAKRVILPGVGSFGAGMEELRKLGMDEALVEVAKSGCPILGICLGMQMLVDSSTENGFHDGLGLISGRVMPISKNGDVDKKKRRKVPHIGWSSLHRSTSKRTWESTCLSTTTEGAYCYFVHSFTVEPADKDHVLAMSIYEDLPIVAAITKDNLTGFQFHPERSGPIGLEMLRRFVCS